MDDDEQQLVVDHADSTPALFAFVDSIFLEEGERIEEDEFGIVERDAMLPEIGRRFLLVPLKALCRNRDVTTFLSDGSLPEGVPLR